MDRERQETGTSSIRRLIEALGETNPQEIVDVSQALITRAHGELLELEKTRDVLVITATIGHWAVPATALKDLLLIARMTYDSDAVLKLVKWHRGKELINTSDHRASFYSHVVVFK